MHETWVPEDLPSSESGGASSVAGKLQVYLRRPALQPGQGGRNRETCRRQVVWGGGGVVRVSQTPKYLPGVRCGNKNIVQQYALPGIQLHCCTYVRVFVLLSLVDTRRRVRADSSIGERCIKLCSWLQLDADTVGNMAKQRQSVLPITREVNPKRTTIRKKIRKWYVFRKEDKNRTIVITFRFGKCRDPKKIGPTAHI